MSASLDKKDYERIVKIDHPKSGLKGFIAIHTTKPGSALGATRMYNYSSEEEALKDAMRLAKNMTYKCAIANLPHGGGKAVLIGDPSIKTDDFLKSYAEEINKLEGIFYTGEDVGMYQQDIFFLQKHSCYFIGTKNKAGDSAPYAALSVLYCMETTLNFLRDTSQYSENLEGVTVAIKGLGKTGLEVARLLLARKAKVIGADINPNVIQKATAALPELGIVSVEEIISLPVDIFAPCALGDDLSERQLNLIRAEIVCGTANNQLESREVGDKFYQKGIVCIPDYLANAGGLIDVADELEPGGYQKHRVLQRIKDLKETCWEVLQRSKEEKISPYRIADKIAEARF
ncbi:MAG: leucine dehydrogenase [Candidatus Doudnabacteria bacterium]